MSRAIKDSAATRSLRTRVELRSTGRLAVGKGTVEIAVHLLNGDILGATTSDDDRQIVRILHLLGAVSDEKAEDLESRLESDSDILGELFGLDLGAVLDEVLQERFVQNLCDFVSSTSTPRFTEQKGVFVANLQMGHDTPALIDEVCRLSDLAKAIDPEALVVRGRGAVGTESARVAIAECLSQEPRTVVSLLHEVAVEPTRARVVLSELLLDGVAAHWLPEGEDQAPLEDEETVASEWRSRPRPSAPPPAPTAPAPVAEAARAIEADAISLDVDDLMPMVAQDVDESELSEEDAVQPAKASPPPAPDTQDDFFPEVDPDDILPEVDPDEMVPLEPETPTDDLGSARGGDSEGVPRSLNEWIADSSSVGEDDLDFFEDHDIERGGDADGRFKTESHNLDKVVVAEMADEDEPIEADEAPTAKFGAPTITEEEARTKIDVANEVLAEVLQAFDQAEGAGRGHAALQLLVDGVPSQFAALLHDLRVGEDGSLPYRTILRNLSNRPTTEHRLLLTNGLSDMIERALSSAADELPDDQIDPLLESVAGYRSRLGL